MMMTTALISVLTLLVGAAVSGLVTYLETRRKLAYDYDADLRKRRIEAYSDLWKRLEPLAKYATKPSVSKTDIKELAENLRIWYFETGGIFLSAAAREAYFALQEVLTHLIKGMGWESPDQKNLTPAAREYLRTYGSRLRTSLTLDVGTRTRPKIRGDAPSVDHRLADRYERTYERTVDKRRLKLQFTPRILPGTRPISIKEIDPVANHESPVKICKWIPAQLTIRVVFDPEGNRRERVLILEDGQLVEGSPPNKQTQAEPALWKPVT
jgi:hypothetical protein